MKRATFWSEFWQDVRYAVRQIRSAPGFAVLVIGTLALGIGASTTIFSAVNAVVLRPLGFADADRVYFLSETWRGTPGDFSAGSYVDVRDQATQFDAIAAIDWANYVLASGETPERVLGAAVSRDYFRVYGVQPVLGRGFTAADEEVGAPRVVILAHSTYVERFGGLPTVIGTDVRVNGEPARVIGVLPADFDPLLLGESIWTPLALTPEQIAARGSRFLDVVGRARAGVSGAAIQQQLDQIAATQRARFPADHEGRGLLGTAIRDEVLGDYDVRLFLLLGAVLVVLLIACANVANLLLARGAARQTEIAVRSALGAGRPRILRQLQTESLVMALMTVVVAVLVATIGAKLIVAFAPGDIPRIEETRVDWVVLAFALTVGILSSVLFGLAPALRAMRADLQSTLRSGGRDGQGSIRDWLRTSLVVAEVTLSVLLLVGAGLLIRTSINIAGVDPGFRTEGVVSARVTLPQHAYEDPARVGSAFQEIVERVAGSAGVSGAAAASLPPLGPGGNEMVLNVEGRAHTNEEALVGRMRLITPGYLEVMDIDLKRGRLFDSRDVAGGVLVAIVSENLAGVLWPGEDPIGKRFACCEGSADAPSYKTVIGVASSVRSQGPTIEPYPEFYIPLTQVPAGAWEWLGRSMSIVASGSTGTTDLVAAVQSGVHAVDPTVPVYAIGTVREALRAVTASARFNTFLLSMLGLLGLVLAVSGIYGVVSYFVNLRTKEIGIRIALGASTRSVLVLVARQAMIPVTIGLTLGTLAATAATRLLNASLYGVGATDPLTFGIVLLGLVTVALIAIVIPARRATRVQPIQALRV